MRTAIEPEAARLAALRAPLAGASELMPWHPHNEALKLHVDVASAIQRGNGDEAHAAMLGIMALASDEMSSIWENESPA